MSWINDCRNQCKKIKYIGSDFHWTEKPNRSSYLVATSDLLDHNLETIKGLYLTGEYRLLKKGRGYVASIALQYYWQPNELRRVFMIESYPDFMRSHRDEVVGQIYGPHLHLGDPRLEQIVKDLHSSDSDAPFSYWIKKFVRHAKVYSNEGIGSIEGPFSNTKAGNLFG